MPTTNTLCGFARAIQSSLHGVAFAFHCIEDLVSTSGSSVVFLREGLVAVKNTSLLSNKLHMHQDCYVKRFLLYGGVNAATGKAIPYVSPTVTIRHRRDKNKPTSMNVNVDQTYLFRFKCSKNANRLSHTFLHESMS